MQVNDKRVYSVQEIMSILEIGKSAAYDLVKRKLFRSVQIGSHIRISRKSFDEWLSTQI